jgi:Holliday junction resolvase
MTCTYFDTCQNNTQCYRCQGCSLLRLPKTRKTLKAGGGSTAWRRMERDVAARLAQAGPAARSQPASGSKWYAPGDVITQDYLIECKAHVTSARGAKQHTILKNHLEKIASEAALLGRLPIYTFRFKGDDKIYAVIDFDTLEEILRANR